MGILEQLQGGEQSGRKTTLGAQCLLGRNRGSTVRLDDRLVSGEHASLHWMGTHWELRDLGSRNGTFVAGRRLAAGERLALRQGDSFSLATVPVRFVLVDAGPPSVLASHMSDGTTRVSEGSVLVLPDDEQPLASIFLNPQGQWVIDLGDEPRLLSDQETIQVGDGRWVLQVPQTSVETWEAGGPGLHEVHLRIGVSRDEEHVEVTVVHGGEQHSLPQRTHHYLLVTLARLWLADRGAEPERGWVDREQLCRMLATDLNKLNVDIHRARKQFSELGIRGAARIVERRQDSGKLRLGIRSVDVFRL